MGAQAARTPAGVALEWAGATLTYAALQGCACAVGAWLAAHGACADRVVALELHRSLEQVVGVVGSLASGGAYLPPLAAGKLSTPADVEYAEWTTFYPTDEHGCRWHVRGDEGDSTRRVHGSPAPQSIAAQPAEEDTALP